MTPAHWMKTFVARQNESLINEHIKEAISLLATSPVCRSHNSVFGPIGDVFNVYR